MNASLSPAHLRILREESAISDAVIEARGYRTVTDSNELKEYGFAPQQCRPGLLIPLHGTDGGNGLYVLRPDAPRSLDRKDKPRNPDGTWPQQVIKYELPKDAKMRIDCPTVCRPALADPAVPLWITEGQKKADALASIGLCALGLLGVWNWRGKNDLGGKTVLADLDFVAWNGRDVRIVFDSDVMEKSEVQQALRRFVQVLQQRGASVAVVYLPPKDDGHKQGVDDYLAAGHGRAELERLVGAPRLEPTAKPPKIELLDAAPSVIRRPLCILDGRAYAAAWLHARVEVSEAVDRKSGDIIRYNPPRVTTEQRLFIVRDDGRIFGDGASEPLAALGLDVALPEVPQQDRLWSALGVKAYLRGERPDPADVFGRVVSVVDRFIDFSRSLASQSTMCELVACYILGTYFTDAFTVSGYLWPNGERGSGKTQLLLAVCELAYLGQVLLAGGSYASLRDLADYGATLAFDDAENTSAAKLDPDKRALLLAGNRKGSVVTVKEQRADKSWGTRHVNAYCPRLFSAIESPDPVLASRSIVVPLIRTPDRYRANADPFDKSAWPVDRQKLVDDLWALALQYLPALPEFEARVNTELIRLTGRNLEPWRAIIAVALWLSDHGVNGLWERMEQLSIDYQRERPDLEKGDLLPLVVRALVERWIEHQGAAALGEALYVTSGELARLVESYLADDDAALDTKPSGTSVGMLLNKMRFKKPPRAGGKGSRKWLIREDDVARWALSYGLDVPTSAAAVPTSE